MLSIFVALSLVLNLVTGAPYNSAITRKACKLIPGDAEWPSRASWDSLNATVNGRLIATIPLPSVCHVEPFNKYNATACTNLKKAWEDDRTLSVILLR